MRYKKVFLNKYFRIENILKYILKYGYIIFKRQIIKVYKSIILMSLSPLYS